MVPAGEENGRGYGSGIGWELEGREAASGCGEETRSVEYEKEKEAMATGFFRESRTSHSDTVLRTYSICVFLHRFYHQH